jgi:hypothetical protein
MEQDDPIVSPTLSPLPTRVWISGRDPLLVVSIVTAQKNPLLDLFVLFLLCIIMHFHLACFCQIKIIWIKLYFNLCSYGFNKPSCSFLILN